MSPCVRDLAWHSNAGTVEPLRVYHNSIDSPLKNLYMHFPLLRNVQAVDIAATLIHRT